MELKYINNMKPELATTETIEYLIRALEIVDEAYTDGSMGRKYATPSCTQNVTLKCGKDLFQIATTPRNFNILYLLEDIGEQDLLQIKKILKFHNIMSEMAKVYRSKGFAFVLAETIRKIKYISFLYNMIHHPNISNGEFMLYEALYTNEKNKYPEAVKLIIRPSHDYEPISRFLATRVYMEEAILPMRVLFKPEYACDFMRETWVKPVRSILPLYELLTINDNAANDLRLDLQNLRRLLKKFVERDDKTTLRISGDRVVYEYVIATGEERVLPLHSMEPRTYLYNLNRPSSLFNYSTLNFTFTGHKKQFPFLFKKAEKGVPDAILSSYDYKVDVDDHPFSPHTPMGEYDLRLLFGTVDL